MIQLRPLLLAAVLGFGLCCGCSAETQNSIPEDALFCDNIAQQVQQVEHLHLATETTTVSTAAPMAASATYAMWFSAADYADTLRNKSADEFRAEMRSRFQNAADLGINTVFVHVRAYQDAYYHSALFPLGTYADPDLDFDPLSILLEEGHGLGLSVHAWVNPLRGPGTKALEEMDKAYLVKQWYDSPAQRGTYLVQQGSNWWLNPAYPEVRQLAADGVAELVQNYPVDGIHIDDYFYPTTDASFDAAAFATGGETDLAAFRLEQTNALVALLYETVKSLDESCLFSISPQGTLHGNYDQQFADVGRWGAQAGYCDMLIPQLYYGFTNETAPFAQMVSLWQDLVTCPEVELVIGICTYKLGQEDVWAGAGELEWIQNLDLPSQQVAYLLEQELDGIAIFDYDATFHPEAASDAMAQQTAAIGELLRS